MNGAKSPEPKRLRGCLPYSSISQTQDKEVMPINFLGGESCAHNHYQQARFARPTPKGGKVTRQSKRLVMTGIIPITNSIQIGDNKCPRHPRAEIRHGCCLACCPRARTSQSKAELFRLKHRKGYREG